MTRRMLSRRAAPVATLVLAGAVAVAGIQGALFLPGPLVPVGWVATALSLLVIALAWPRNGLARPAAALVLGCILGCLGSVALVTHLAGQARVQVTVESTGFQATVETLLARRDCEAAALVLDQDLELLALRPMMAALVRKEMWDAAAAHGCIASPALRAARNRLRLHVLSSPPPPGLTAGQALARMGLGPEGG